MKINFGITKIGNYDILLAEIPFKIKIQDCYMYISFLMTIFLILCQHLFAQPEPTVEQLCLMTFENFCLSLTANPALVDAKDGITGMTILGCAVYRSKMLQVRHLADLRANPEVPFSNKNQQSLSDFIQNMPYYSKNKRNEMLSVLGFPVNENKSRRK